MPLTILTTTACSYNKSLNGALMVNSISKAFLSCTWGLRWYSGKSPATLVIHHLFPAVKVVGSNPAPPFSRPAACAKLWCTPLSAPSEL